MNFDKIVKRGETSCVKWDLMHDISGKEDILPFWIADMDFESPEPIKEALKKRIEHGIFGYSYPSERLLELIIERMKKKYGWSIEREWIVFTPGVVPALGAALRALTHPGDEVLLQSPVYHPFFSIIASSGCQTVNNKLILENNKYSMDTRSLNETFLPREGVMPVEGRIKAMILCSPHNPVGRVWRRDELEALGDVIMDKKAVVISDEIHCDVMLRGRKHTPFSSIDDFEQRSMVCMSGSKTFNIAGLSTAFTVIPNEDIRKSFIRAKSCTVPEPGVLGLTALEAAFESCDPWLESLLRYLEGNLDLLKSFFAEKLPEIRAIELDGTYLVWLDFRSLNIDDRTLERALLDSGVMLEGGRFFGEGGSGFERMNIACPRKILMDGLERIASAVELAKTNHSGN